MAVVGVTWAGAQEELPWGRSGRGVGADRWQRKQLLRSRT